jgi:catechol 2,3-dioxygenase-like lactoylglutathione lyase family enzyme
MHCCVEVENDLAALIPYLKERGISLIDEQPVPRMGARGMGLSIYTLDPDGYVVELKEANA